MNPKEVSFLKNLQKNLEGGAVQPDELVEVVKAILAIIVETKRSLELQISNQKDESNTHSKDAYKSIEKCEERMMKLMQRHALAKDFEAVKSTLFRELRRIENLIPDTTDLKPLERKIEEATRELEAKIPKLPEEMGGEKVIEKINRSQGVIKRERVENLNEELKRIEEKIDNKPVGMGGGVTNARIAQAFKYIAHTEQPTGAINGSNTVYTVRNNIWWIAGFTLNGEQIAQLPNFTYSGRTITFSAALPAAYSGKDFEIKYIGS